MRHQRIASIVGVLLAGCLLSIATVAGAQRRPCVEETTPPPAAGEQAECWFGRRDFRQAAAWCGDADLSEESAGNLCFTAFVRAGRFDDAARVAGTLERVRPAARACHAAFTTGLRVRIVPNPANGVVTIDTESYGRGPTEVMLAPPFWDHRVSVRFRERTVRVSERRLRRALEPETCGARDIVVDGPESDGGGVDSPTGAWALTIAGAVTAVAGASLFAWGTVLAADVEERQRDDEPAASLEPDRDMSIGLRASGGIAGALGVAMVGLGAYLVVTWSNDGGGTSARLTTRTALGF